MIKRILKRNFENLLLKKPFNIQKIDSKKPLNIKPQLFYRATRENNINAFVYLLENYSFDINSVDENKENLLFYAVKYKASDIVKKLLFLNINLNQINQFGLNVLPLVIKNEDAHLLNRLIPIYKNKSELNYLLFYTLDNIDDECFNVLLNFNVDINFKNNTQNSIVHEYRFSTKKRKFYEKAFNHGIDLFKLNALKEDFYSINLLNKDISEDLFKFIIAKSNFSESSNQYLYVNILLSKLYELEPNIVDKKEEFALYLNRLILLSENGLNINAANHDKESIVFELVKLKKVDILNNLIKNTNLDLNSFDKKLHNALYYAVFSDEPNLDIIRLMISCGADYLEKDGNGYSIINYLFNVILSEYNPTRIKRIKKTLNYNSYIVKTLNFLLETQSLDLNKLHINDEPILHYVVKSLNTALLEKLLKYNLNINILNKDKLNAMHTLLRLENIKNNEVQAFIKMVTFLVSRNIELLQKDNLGGNSLHYSILKHDFKIINILFRRTMDFSISDKNGRTYAHYAVWDEKIDVIRKLSHISKELINTPDKFGFLPLNYAILFAKDKAAVALLNCGAYVNNVSRINSKYKEHLFSTNKNIGYSGILEKNINPSTKKQLQKAIEIMKEKFN